MTSPGLDFAARLDFVLKALSIGRGRLAADLGVDKSLVTRWLGGTIRPSGHNLERLSRLIAAQRPGFTMLDWDTDLSLLAARVGVVAPVGTAGLGRAAGGAAASPRPVASRPSIAVLPFHRLGGDGPHAIIAEALPHEIIAELSRLRWLLVVARGSSFRFRDPDPDIARIGTVLGVDYCLSGTLELIGTRIVVHVELADTRTAGVVWSERYAADADGVHDIRSAIAVSVIAALEIQIPLHAAQTAAAMPPDSLDAWANYHLGVQHMYRTTVADNDMATRRFAAAVDQAPDFARAHAGLSFTHFRNSFLYYRADLVTEGALARHHAERAVSLDALDAFANMAMGRCYWLTGEMGSSVGWLDRAVTLNPNYAQGMYAAAMTQTMLCDGAAGQARIDEAMLLSPIDPMRSAMLGVRALSHLVRSEDRDAADWGERAASGPDAHPLISLIAATCHELTGDTTRAHFWINAARQGMPALGQSQFFRSFPLRDEATRDRIAGALTRMNL